jgi:transmembrane sensor
MLMGAAVADNRVLEAAAHWYALLSSGAASEHERARWQAWLAADPSHRQAWQQVEDVGAQFDALVAQPMGREASMAGLDAAQRGRRNRRRLLMVALMAGATGILGLSVARSPVGRRTWAAWQADLVTPVGGSHEATLADGTRIQLNTDTALTVDYTREQRRLVLLRGEIMIATAPDPTRTFVVDTPEGRLQALGTRFNVQSVDGDTTLAVLEGAVQAHFVGGPQAGYRVDAGMRMRGGAQGIGTPATLSAQDHNWTRGILQFEEAPLARVVAELARYRRGYLGCADEISALRVTGTFPLHDTDHALRLLSEALPLRISQPLPWWTTLQPR